MSNVPAGFALTWTLGGQKERIELGSQRMVVGRAQGVEIHINTPNVSRRHAAFTWENDGWVLADLGSSNGTWVNRQRIVSTRLKHGDAIAFGPLEARFLAPVSQQDVQDLVVIEEGQQEVQHSILVSMEKLEGAMLPGPRAAEPTSQMRPRGGTSQLQPARGGDLGARAIGLFSQAAKALLASRSLDEILEKIMDLVFDVLPAERGFVGLIEPGQSEPVPRIMRTRTGNAEKITISRSIASTAIHERNAILVIDAPSDPRFQEQQSILLMKIRSAMCAPLYHEGQVQGLIYVDTQSATSFFDQDALEMLATLAVLAAVGVQQTRLREEIAREQKIREHLGRYSSPAVVEQIIRTAGTGAIEMHAEERDVSVLFADLTGFTAMSETMAPTEVTRMLNSLFDRLTQVIFRLEGTLDKFMGDAIMAVFGAPLAQEDHAVRAVTAAMQMQAELAVFNQGLGDGREIRMRIGINSGPVVAGDVGSPQRKEYTVIGDTVNVASRLESSVAAPGQVVVGPATCAMVQHCYQCQALPPAALKGKALRIQPYLVHGPLAEDETVRPPA